jgi:hypothetical protein
MTGSVIATSVPVLSGLGKIAQAIDFKEDYSIQKLA